jgi:hypothetical protein
MRQWAYRGAQQNNYESKKMHDFIKIHGFYFLNAAKSYSSVTPESFLPVNCALETAFLSTGNYHQGRRNRISSGH